MPKPTQKRPAPKPKMSPFEQFAKVMERMPKERATEAEKSADHKQKMSAVNFIRRNVSGMTHQEIDAFSALIEKEKKSTKSSDELLLAMQTAYLALEESEHKKSLHPSTNAKLVEYQRILREHGELQKFRKTSELSGIRKAITQLTAALDVDKGPDTKPTAVVFAVLKKILGKFMPGGLTSMMKDNPDSTTSEDQLKLVSCGKMSAGLVGFVVPVCGFGSIVIVPLLAFLITLKRSISRDNKAKDSPANAMALAHLIIKIPTSDLRQNSEFLKLDKKTQEELLEIKNFIDHYITDEQKQQVHEGIMRAGGADLYNPEMSLQESLEEEQHPEDTEDMEHELDNITLSNMNTPPDADRGTGSLTPPPNHKENTNQEYNRPRSNSV